MTPFIRIQPTLANTMAYRNNLMAAPYEYFKGLFGCHVRTLQDKLLAIERCVQRVTSAASFQNDTYAVMAVGDSPFIHLIIHRHDWAACNDWREFQRIKNEIVGPECEAMELFPPKAGSWILPTPTTFGFTVIRLFVSPSDFTIAWWRRSRLDSRSNGLSPEGLQSLRIQDQQLPCRNC
jgi:hypothetical protein